MNNRICPTEETLSAYLSGSLTKNEVSAIETHLTACKTCRELVFDTYDLISKPVPGIILSTMLSFIKKNVWGLLSLVSFTLSFTCGKYFFQFLAASILLGLKWITDSKTTKTLIMIHEAWKRGDKESADNILSKFDIKK